MSIPTVTPGCQFASDNTAPMSPGAWESLARANEECQSSYGDDAWTARAGELLREIKTPGDPHEVRELLDGNLLIACGEGEALLEINREGKTVWKLGTHEVPNNPLRLISGFQRLKDGHTLVVNWLGHGYLATTAQFFEIDGQKKIVRQFTDHSQFTSINKVQLLDVSGDPAKGEVLR
jgi:hypothetical protein